MAVLSDVDRAAEWAEFMRVLSADREPVAVNKNDLRAALNAADQWAEDNAVSFNAALPEPAKSNLTAGQKARMLVQVIKRRWEVAHG